MYSSLLDAQANTDLVLLEITSTDLTLWLQRLGLFVGSHIIRHNKEINYYPVRVRGSKGDVVIPAGLAIKTFVHLDNGDRKPLVEMKKKEKGHIETLSCGRSCKQAAAYLGMAEDTDVTFIRALPHMDYITVIDKKKRTRLSEGEAARLWGKCENADESQFYFAQKKMPFIVQEIIGGRKIQEHLKTHGVGVGCTLVLETIEQTRELHKPGVEPVTISGHGGLRLYLKPCQAEKIIVKNATRDHGNHEAGQSDENRQVGY